MYNKAVGKAYRNAHKAELATKRKLAREDELARPYKPQGRTGKIIDRAMAHVKSVPYKVGVRWIFYRLYQENIYKTKKDYFKLDELLTMARRRYYKEWRPWTLADDSRLPIHRGNGFNNETEWLESLGEETCILSRWAARPVYLEIWYEARAMTGQFQEYTQDVTLRPFAGESSVPSRWDVVEHFAAVHEAWPDKPIHVIYFGDDDEAGYTIPKVILKDTQYWCGQKDIKFEYHRGGLNPGDGKDLDVPESIEHPGTYQWEGLTDANAKKLIEKALAPFPDNIR